MKKVLPVLLAAVLSLMPLTLSASGQTLSGQAFIKQELSKDETVYANLGYDGSVKEIYVVNRINTPEAGLYEDFGLYETIVNLTNSIQPVITDESIQWQLPKDPRGFYYQGKLYEAQLPFLIDIKYMLDGREMPARAIAGKSGDIRLRFTVTPNPDAAAYFKENFMLQLQIPLSLDTCSGIKAPGSSMVIAGRTATLAYMVLPGTIAEFEISFYSPYFELGSISMTGMPLNLNSYMDNFIDMEEIRSGITQLSEGAGRLADGTVRLRDGLKELSSGLQQVSAGAGQLDDSMPEFQDGIKKYTGGVDELAKAAAEISDNLELLAREGERLKDGFNQIYAGITMITDPVSQLPLLPESIKSRILEFQSQLGEYKDGLSQYIDGVGMISDGMKEFTAGMSKLASSNQELLGGLALIVDGMGELAKGLEKTAKEVKKLPGEVQKLVDGQKELKSGIDKARTIFDELGGEEAEKPEPVSFVSDRVKPNSVQFILKTPELKPDSEKNNNTRPEEDQKSFWQRLKELFT
ncbi:MAG TPA: hypothetical protein PK830_02805 [Candidatus Atribacteria bacterium]|nr:hypothetical protein [Candidatus Atribacteria bacterium]HPT78021.1 hypothetical protein [Candidatus Atribacteria bacterium]